MARARLTIATDGACPNNGRDNAPGGWGWAADDGRSDSGGEPPPSKNGRMEMMAVREALAAHPDIDVHIQSDSKYVVDGFTEHLAGWKARGWRKADKKPLENLDLVRDIDRLLQGRTVTWEWVKAHNGHPLNEQADKLAAAAAEQYRGAPAILATFVCQACFLTRPADQLAIFDRCVDCT